MKMCGRSPVYSNLVTNTKEQHTTFKEGSRHCLLQLYKVVVLPHLDYCSCVWDPTHKTKLQLPKESPDFRCLYHHKRLVPR